MTTKQTGGPAFPPFHDPKNHESGMTLRDYFAGQALVGMNAADRRWDGGNVDMATAAYSQADAMLKARDQ